jgi:colanic acid biosynthesis glycosyl transferase WcaI
LSPKLIVVTDYYYPDDISTGYFLTGIAEGLAKQHRVEVLCGQPSSASGASPAPSRETRNGVGIRRFYALGTKDKSLISRLVRSAHFGAAVLLGLLLRLHRDDVVLVVTNPPFLPFPVALACRLRRARGVLLVHDVYPDAFVASGLLRRRSWATRGLARAYAWLYRQFARVVVLGRDMRRLIAARLPPGAPDPVIIANWGDTDAIAPQPRQRNALLQRLGIADKFIVQFSGNLGRTHDIEILRAAAGTLRDERDIHFLVAGWGIKRSLLERLLAEETLPNITLLPRATRIDLATLLGACDVLAIAFVAGMSGISVPSRLYNMMAAGRPIVAATDADSELATVVAEDGIGWVVRPGDAAALVATLREARHSPERRAAAGARARAAALNKYRDCHAIAAYDALFSGLRETQPG